FAQDTGRPEKFSALHFANDIREKNTAEVMGHEGTSEWVINLLLDFAESIGMVPLHVQKEHPGYLLNSLLVPFLTAGQGLWPNGIADPEKIDKIWIIATGAPLGPFGNLDILGIETDYNIVKSQVEADHTKQPILDALEKNFIDKGKFCKSSGEGFYKYPNPKYTHEDFLK